MKNLANYLTVAIIMLMVPIGKCAADEYAVTLTADGGTLSVNSKGNLDLTFNKVQPKVKKSGESNYVTIDIEDYNGELYYLLEPDYAEPFSAATIGKWTKATTATWDGEQKSWKVELKDLKRTDQYLSIRIIFGFKTKDDVYGTSSQTSCHLNYMDTNWPVELVATGEADDSGQGAYVDGMPAAWAHIKVNDQFPDIGLNNIQVYFVRDNTDIKIPMTQDKATETGVIYEKEISSSSYNENGDYINTKYTFDYCGVLTEEAVTFDSYSSTSNPFTFEITGKVEVYNSDGSLLSRADAKLSPYTLEIKGGKQANWNTNADLKSRFNVSFYRNGDKINLNQTSFVVKYSEGEELDYSSDYSTDKRLKAIDATNTNVSKTDDNTYTFESDQDNLYVYWLGDQKRYGTDETTKILLAEESLMTGRYYSTSEYGYQNYLGETTSGESSGTFARANDDLTGQLSPTWTNAAATVTDVDWTGNSRKMYNVEGGTAISQTVSGLTADNTYTVQAIMSVPQGKTVTLKLNNETVTVTGIDNTKSIVNKYGRVDRLYLIGKGLDQSIIKDNLPTSGGWQKIEKTITLDGTALNIEMQGTDSWKLSDVTLLENANTRGHFYTTIAPIANDETGMYDDDDKAKVMIGAVNKISFFDRGENPNRVVIVNQEPDDDGITYHYSDILDFNEDHRHPFNVASYNKHVPYYAKNTSTFDRSSIMAYTIPLLYLTNTPEGNEPTAFYCPNTGNYDDVVVADNVSFDRNFKAGQWSSVALPVFIPQKYMWLAAYGKDNFYDALKDKYEIVADKYSNYDPHYDVSDGKFGVFKEFDGEKKAIVFSFVQCLEGTTVGRGEHPERWIGNMQTNDSELCGYAQNSNVVPFWICVKEGGMPFLNMTTNGTTLLKVRPYERYDYSLENYLGNMNGCYDSGSYNNYYYDSAFIGVYKKTTLKYGDYKMNAEGEYSEPYKYFFWTSGNKFYEIQEGVTVNFKPFQAFVVVPSSAFSGDGDSYSKSLDFVCTSEQAPSIDTPVDEPATDPVDEPVDEPTDEIDGIDVISSGSLQKPVFDLQGRKVADLFSGRSLPKGIYVVDGKKFVVR